MVKRHQVRFTRHYAREWREHAGLTLEEAGERMGRSHATLSRIENRKVALTQPVLDEMARVYGTSRGSILDRPPDKDGRDDASQSSTRSSQGKREKAQQRKPERRK